MVARSRPTPRVASASATLVACDGGLIVQRDPLRTSSARDDTGVRGGRESRNDERVLTTYLLILIPNPINSMDPTNSMNSMNPMDSVNPDCLARVAQTFNLRLVVLYGSRARRRPPPRPDSDVDVAVLGCPPGQFWACYLALCDCVTAGPLDMVRLESAGPLFRQEIMREGILLHGDPDLFAEYHAFAYRDFVDSADLFALEATLFRKKMSRLGEALRDPA